MTGGELARPGISLRLQLGDEGGGEAHQAAGVEGAEGGGQGPQHLIILLGQVRCSLRSFSVSTEQVFVFGD